MVLRDGELERGITVALEVGPFDNHFVDNAQRLFMILRRWMLNFGPLRHYFRDPKNQPVLVVSIIRATGGRLQNFLGSRIVTSEIVIPRRLFASRRNRDKQAPVPLPPPTSRTPQPRHGGIDKPPPQQITGVSAEVGPGSLYKYPATYHDTPRNRPSELGPGHGYHQSVRGHIT